MRPEYEGKIYLFLSVYRFFSYGVAVILIQVVPGTDTALGQQTYLLLATVGAYTLVKILSPIRWWDSDLITNVVLGGDVLVSLLAVSLTGGLTSGFLLYSFLPIITTALLFEERITLATATVTSVCLVFLHVVLSNWEESFLWVMEENILLWLVFYVIASYIISLSVFRTNLNIRQLIQHGAVSEERRRMKAEIHDGVAQTLTYLSMKTDQVSRMIKDGEAEKARIGMEDVREAVTETYKAVRESLDHLSMEVGSEQLDRVLKEYLEQFQNRYEIETKLEATDSIPALPELTQLQVVRIIQEALANVRKHSGATGVCVTLSGDRDRLTLSVKDNGVGFEIGGNGANGIDEVGHHGLLVMRERAVGLGGTLAINSSPGQGAEVRVTLPTRIRGGMLWRR